MSTSVGGGETMMQALEMEEEEEEEEEVDTEDDEEVRFLPDSSPSHPRIGALPSRRQQQRQQQSRSRSTSDSTDNGFLGYGKMILVAGTMLGFWLLAYRVNTFKSSAAAAAVAAADAARDPTTNGADVTADAAADAASSSGVSHRKANTTPSTTSSAAPRVKVSGPYSTLSQIVPDPEHVPIDAATAAAVAEQWGNWHFWDGEEDNRPGQDDDYCGKYPNRDIPGDDFPEEAWQTDAVYVNHILDDGEQLVGRTMEAIFTEYGWGKPQTPQGLSERLKLFRWERYKLAEMTAPSPKYASRGDQGGGGWTTDRSYDGLVRRLLHAMMTNDDFTVVLGGHSAAAGHGNHFRQSYLMVFHRIMAPVFARLGMRLVTRNLSQGGLGTIQNALGMKDLYGQEIDLLLWDCSMTEPGAADIDYFLRMGLLSGQKVPVLWGGTFNVLQNLHQHADADVGITGTGMDGVPLTTSRDQALEKVPFAAQFLKCSTEAAALCNEDRFCATCWIDRPDLKREDLFEDARRAKPKGQVKWHPGWRWHQLKGRVLALSILDALQVAIQTFSDGTMGGPPLDEAHWHVTDYYNNIREKVKNLKGACHEGIEPRLPKRVCDVPMHGRSLYTPRANPQETSLLNIIKPAPNGYVPQNKNVMLYTGPDVHNQCYDIPSGQVDVLAVASAGKTRRRTRRGRRLHVSNHRRSGRWLVQNETMTTEAAENHRQLADDTIVPGKGWEHREEPPGDCDGTYDAICGRHRQSYCPMIGHHDYRGFLAGNEYSGWLVMEIPEMKEGLILLKIMTWSTENDNTITKDWATVNGERRRQQRHLLEDDYYVNTTYAASRRSRSTVVNQQEERQLDLKSLPDTFFFDYAINGKITSLDKAAFTDKLKLVQRVVEIMTLLDDPAFGAQEKVEVAIRMRGCGKTCTFGVTHLYWA